MPRRIFSNRAKRAWWSVHVKACRESGLTMSAYCRLHGLTRSQFVVWVAELDEWEAQKSEERRRWKRRSTPVPVEKRHRATQAFWAMHVEAWQWSGLPLREYSAALRLSPYSLRRWRQLIESEVLEIDWRAMLHPSSMPPISTNISTRTNESERAKALTAAIEAEAGPPRRATRRRYTTEQKIALLLETERHGESVSSVGRAHGIATSVLFRWRDQFGFGKEKPAVLVPVRIVEGGGDRSGEPSSLADLLRKPEGMAEVELADGRRVFAPADADPEAVRREVAARELRP